MSISPGNSHTSLDHVDSVKEPVAIIGAGPAGLTIAWELAKAGRSAIVFERDTQVGGLARTIWYKGYGFDIGGHRFFTRIERVQAAWKELLGEDFVRVPRLSRIYYKRKFFNYPLKPWNALRGLGIGNSVAIVGSYLWRRIRPLPHEEFFEQYIINRFGDRLYRIFFKTFTEKVWGIPCTEIRSDWAAQRIKGLCLKEAVKNALTGNADGDVKSLIDEFDYPRLGPGQLWEKMASEVETRGSRVETCREVVRIDHDGAGKILRIAHVSTDDPSDVQEISAPHYCSTMPLRTLLSRMNPPPPTEVLAAAQGLRYRDFITVNLILNEDNLFPDNWIYVHSPDVKVGRIQNFKNWSRDLVPESGYTGIGMEYFCFEGDDTWSMGDDILIQLAKTELLQLGLAQALNVIDGFVVREKKAYPMYDEHFQKNITVVRDWLERFRNLHTIGRNGLHKYNNQDHSMLTAMLAADNLLTGTNHDIWQVNTDSDYQETR